MTWRSFQVWRAERMKRRALRLIEQVKRLKAEADALLHRAEQISQRIREHDDAPRDPADEP